MIVIRGDNVRRSKHSGHISTRHAYADFFLYSADSEPVAIAVIFNAWELVQGPLRAFAMVTTDSVPPLSDGDSRMPAILANEDEISTWLGETGANSAELKALLRPYADELVMREQDRPKKDAPPPKPKKGKPVPQPGLF